LVDSHHLVILQKFIESHDPTIVNDNNHKNDPWRFLFYISWSRFRK